MSKVTSKRQITIPKHIADQYQIEEGDDLSWIAEGDAIRLVVGTEDSAESLGVEERLSFFDRATERQTRRQRSGVPTPGAGTTRRTRKGRGRGWSREDLYDRDVPR